MTAKNVPEIIDLTISPSTLEYIVVPSDEDITDLYIPEPRNLLAYSQEIEAKKSRRKKRKKSFATGNQENTSTSSRENSVELGEISETPAKRNRSANSLQKYLRTDQNGQKRANKTDTVPSRPDILSDAVADIFFVDIQPATLPLASSLTPMPHSEEDSHAKLLLPAHVSVLGSTPIEILPSSIPDVDEESEDFIKYLDYEDHKEFVRYFEEKPTEESKLNRTVCKNCGAEGEHKTSACPVLICLTCGARNEHHTRSCPISKVCFTCGMKGHINANCPNRHQARAFASGRYDDCDRCGSGKHKTNECPTWWRLYEYLTEEERSKVISLRLSKKKLKLGEGGEGYVADDEWCYNCGYCGHWGDDCNDTKRFDCPEEPSAFSLYNIMSGPFFNPDEEKQLFNYSRRGRHDRENELDQWGKGAPQNVGRQGKKKQMDKLAKTYEQLDEDDDDWFGKQNSRDPAQRQINSTKKLAFGKSLQDGKKIEHLASRAPSLLSRLSDGFQCDGPRLSARYNENNGESYSSAQSSRSRNRDRDRDRDREKNRNRDRYRGHEGYSGSHGRSKDNGPRYKGGYPH
ncbi:hypothetical protein BDQ17DRAFT_1275502 [Cyathus striatus]|nr:hypothetical protein BDQ17DRAFT_1275502 [Cyathus striatus]